MKRETDTTAEVHPFAGFIRSKRGAWVGGSAGLIVAGGILLGVLGGPAAVVASAQENQVVATAIPALAPADADTFVVAPYTKDWWRKVAAMAPPETGLEGLDPSAAGVAIERLGYSRSKDNVQRELPRTGPLRLVYIESGTPEAAKSVSDWLQQAEGFEGRRVFLRDRTVVVGPSWVDTYEPPSTSLAAVPGFRADVTGRQGSMWRNTDAEVAALTSSSGDPKAKAALETVMSKGYGFASGTTWIGTSDSGDVWSGDFQTGGVVPSQIDFKGTYEVLDSGRETLAKADFGNVKYELFDAGVGDLLRAASFSAPGQPSTLGAARVSMPGLENPAVTVVSDVTRYNAAATGISSSQENIGRQAISADEHKMVIALEYSK